MVFLGLVGIRQLVDEVPERILASGNRIPPSFQPLPILLQVFLVPLQLKGQIVGQQCFLFVRIVDFHHHVPDYFLFSVILADVQLAHKRIILVVLVKIAPDPPFPEASHNIQISKCWVFDQVAILALPPLVASHIPTHLETH